MNESVGTRPTAEPWASEGESGGKSGVEGAEKRSYPESRAL